MQARAAPPQLASAQFTNTGAKVNRLGSGEMSKQQTNTHSRPELADGCKLARRVEKGPASRLVLHSGRVSQHLGECF